MKTAQEIIDEIEKIRSFYLLRLSDVISPDHTAEIVRMLVHLHELKQFILEPTECEHDWCRFHYFEFCLKCEISRVYEG